MGITEFGRKAKTFDITVSVNQLFFNFNLFRIKDVSNKLLGIINDLAKHHFGRKIKSSKINETNDFLLFQQEIAKAREKLGRPATSGPSSQKTDEKSQKNDSGSSSNSDDDEDEDIVGPLPPKELKADDAKTKYKFSK